MGVRGTSLLRRLRTLLVWSALLAAASLGTAPAAGAEKLAPDPAPNGTALRPDAYPSAEPAPAPVRIVEPPSPEIVVTVTAALPSAPSRRVVPPARKPPQRHHAVRPRHATPSHRRHAGLETAKVSFPTLALTRFGAAVAAPSGSPRTVSVPLALALAGFVLLSGVFVATATREAMR